MRITQTRAPQKPGVQIVAPGSVDVRVSKDHVEISDKRITTLTNDNIRVTLNKEDEEEWRSLNWLSVQDEKRLAEEALQSVKEANTV